MQLHFYFSCFLIVWMMPLVAAKFNFCYFQIFHDLSWAAQTLEFVSRSKSLLCDGKEYYEDHRVYCFFKIVTIYHSRRLFGPDGICDSLSGKVLNQKGCFLTWSNYCFGIIIPVILRNYNLVTCVSLIHCWLCLSESIQNYQGLTQQILS